jgi:hypothetical protein
MMPLQRLRIACGRGAYNKFSTMSTNCTYAYAAYEPQGNRKAIREGDDRGDDRMGGNCVVEKNDRLTPLKSALLDFESNERLLYIPAS